MPNRKYLKGKDGRVFVTEVEMEITQWEGSGEHDEESLATSMTDGKKIVIPGNGQFSGQVQGKMTAEQVAPDMLQDGDFVALKLYITQAAQGTNKKIYVDIPDAFISSLQLASDPSGGGGASFQFAFKSSGDYTYKHES